MIAYTGRAEKLRKDQALARKPRADALRNRDRLLAAAKAAFAEVGPEVSLEEIARRAGVGIGTLYRHFPTRDAIVEAVYRREVEQLSESARQLLETRPAGEALHQWMRDFVDYITAKKIIAPSLQSMVGGPTAIYESSGETITKTVYLLVERAKKSGHIIEDIAPDDVIRAMIGFTHINPKPGWDTSARRLIDIFMNGLRTEPGTELAKPT